MKAKEKKIGRLAEAKLRVLKGNTGGRFGKRRPPDGLPGL